MPPFSPEIIRFDSLPSTNTEASRRAIEGAPEGVCVVAAEQTAGRGRLQRHWVSPKSAGLYFSIILRPQFDQSLWPLITLTAAVAVHDVLVNACGLSTDIKWPNDILVSDKKLCGILAETIETSLGRAVILGIGINLTSEAIPTDLQDVATSVEDVSRQKPDTEVVLQALIRAFQARHEIFHRADGPEEILREWRMRSSYAEGKVVQVTEGTESFVGRTSGLERDGALRVETEAGNIRIVRAGDVTALREISK